jgi:uncharacterized membrane protein YfcA
MSIVLLWEHRRELSVGLLAEAPGFARWSPLLLIAGVAAGTALLGSVPAAAGRLALAVVVLVFVVLQVRSRPGAASERHTSAAVVEATTFCGGLVDGWLGTGGVPVALHLAWRRLPPTRFVTTILLYFLASDTVRAVAYTLAGHWSRPTLGLCLAAAPFAVAGYAGGVLMRRRFASATMFRAVVLTLLALYCVALVVRVLTGSPA